MREIMEKLPINDQIKSALVDNTGACAQFLQAAIALERDQHVGLSQKCAELEISADDIPGCYLTAIKYANGLV